MKAECWVTVAESDGEGWAAMVLARSIRKTLTTRKLTIAISENVSHAINVLLQREFDVVVRFETSEVGRNGNGVLWLWNLRLWSKCVYVDPKSIMLQNSDELFSQPAFSASVNTTDDNGISPNLFVFQPNRREFENLVELGENLKGLLTPSTEHTYIHSTILYNRFKYVLENRKHQIPVSFFSNWKESITTKGLPLDSNLMTFDQLPWKNDCNYNDDVLYKWAAIFVHEVIPQVDHWKNENQKEFLMKSLEEHGFSSTNGPVTLNSDQFDDLGGLVDGIAVVGMSCRFPGANNPDEFWDLLVSGQDPIRRFPSDRARPSYQQDEDEKNFEAGFLKCPVDEFDAKFFGISPREAPFVDPQQRLLLEVIWESLENANINPHGLKESKTGVFVGVWQQEYEKLFSNVGLTANEFHHRYLGNAFSATASRISHFLGLYGPNYAIESGCSSSSSGVHLACQSLRRGETTLAIASGVNLVLHFVNPFGGDDLGAIVLSNDFRCKTFDERANGFVRAEGCGAVVLKPLAAAIREGDNVLGVIRGTALNNDGPATSFGTPNAMAQEMVFREALTDAGVEPRDVSFVEAHGTATVVGDPTEMYAIEQVYSEGRTETLLVSSVKSNIGHSESCAGMAGLIKVLLCLQHKKVPPHLHLQKLNPRINLENIPAKIPLEVTEWDAETRIAAVSSFSMSGTNVHLIVQETPQIFKTKIKLGMKMKALQMIGISAKSDEALEALCGKYISFLQSNPHLPLADVAHSLNTGRAKMSHRIGLVANDTEQLLAKLEKRTYIIGKAPQQKQKIVFLFTGQGSQYFGMAKGLYEVSPVFQSSFGRCDALFRNYLSISLKQVLWEDSSLLEKTIYCQTAIFSIQYCLVQLWNSFGIRPDFVIGHSVGEFCAAVCAGVLSLDDGMKLVVGRSKLVDSLEEGKMLAIRTSPVETRRLIKEFSNNVVKSWIDVAAENSIEEVVVSGNPESVQKFSEFCAERGVKTQSINASHAFHSRHMDFVLKEFGDLASEVIPGKPTCGYISGTLAREMKEGEFEQSYWQRHLRDTVRFQEAIQFAWESPRDGRILIEIGTQPILLSLAMGNVAECSAGTFCPSLRKSEDDLSSVLNSLSKLFVAGVEISWKEWNQGANKIILPTYPFQRQKFWYSSELDEIPLPPILHPLLGRQFPAPVADHIYTQILSTKNLSYVSDHRVAERVILPAAAYLESIMAAGCQVLQGGRVQVPFCVEDLMVEAPLELTKSAQVQTIVRSVGGDQGVKFEIGIHKQVSNEEFGKWKRHAVATFSPSMQGTTTAPVDIKGLQERMSATESISTAYEAVAKAGIQFGPKFQSISEAWKGEKEVLTKIILPEDSPSYICHPIVLDAMIQTFAFRTALTSPSDKIELQLPISIKKFTWCSRSLTSMIYAYTTWTESGEGTVTLFNENGEVLARMEGLELLRTTVASFVRALNIESNSLPDFMEVIWKPTSGITRSRVDASMFKIEVSSFTDKMLKRVSEIESKEMQYAEIAGEIFFQYLLRGVQESNWPWPGIGERIQDSDWTAVAPQELQIVKSGALLKLFEASGYVEKESYGIYKVLSQLPSLDKIEVEIKRLFVASEMEEETVFYQYTKRCGIHFSSVLQGKMSPIAYLFPSEANEIGALRFYADANVPREIAGTTTSLILDCVSPCAGINSGIVRILEVGAGSGICCTMLLEGLAQLNLGFHYTFTDISPLILHEAKKKFSKGVTLAVFNIEEDPLTQGFAPQEFDVIIAANVIHATQNIVKTLKNLRLLLRPDGILSIGEIFVSKTYLTLSFGILDGWWRFNDFRKDSPLINQAQWKEVMKETGFSDVGTLMLFGVAGTVIGRKNDSVQCTPISITNTVESAITHDRSWYFCSDESPLEEVLSRKMLASGRTVVNSLEGIAPTNLEGILFFWTTNVENSLKGQGKCKELLHLCQQLLTYTNVKQKPKLFLVTRGVNYLGDAGPGNPNSASASSFLRSFVNESPEFPISVIDVDQDEVNLEGEAEEVFASLWSNEKEMFKAVREDKIFVQRLVSAGRRKPPIPLPNSNRFVILNPASKNINDLEITVDAGRELKEDEVEVAIRATALNFRDIFLILQPEGFQIPDSMPKEPGLDISGIISAVGPQSTKFKVGDPVFGFTNSRGFASHVIISERLLIRKPPELTFPSAATLPVAFTTVFWSFHQLAKLRAGDRVLIHVATGGVGLAAIQMAKHIGAEIYATAGSRRKRAYLRSIGIQHVYHSRNTAFGDEILRDTNGAGVTVILNSLTGPNFKETSLRTCSQGARFVEIGQINIWSEEDMRTLRPDVAYFVVELAIRSHENPEILKGIGESLEVEFHQQIYMGLPHDAFPLDLIREAFNYFQEAKHIGKIVINMPEAKVSPEGRITFHQNLFHPESTYLITGGLGGLGMEVAKWMCEKGAQNIILSGRSPTNDRNLDTIQRLNENGSRVFVIQADVGYLSEFALLHEAIRALNLPPLRGIMHGAGVLSDAVVANQTWEAYESIFHPKIHGTWNLHRLTLGHDLEFFAMFSSVASILGMPGQSNHAAANHFMDSFAYYRTSLGLPATTMNFGPWSDVGAAANLRFAKEGLFGMRSFSPKMGIAAIEKVFRERSIQNVIIDVCDWTSIKEHVKLGHYLDEMRSAANESTNLIEVYQVLIDEAKNASPKERQEKIEYFLDKVLKDILRIPENEQLDREQNFSEIGVDSLMAMELRNRLQGMLGEKQLTVSALQENRTIRSLSAHMANLMNSEYSSPVDFQELVIQDSILPPDILAPLRPAVTPSEFREILLTGATGHLGVNLLPALQRENPNLIIHCIVRGKDSEEANARLRKNLQLYSLLEKVNLENIRVIPGDLTKDNFSFPPETYENLTESVDAIVHCAVKSNHLEEYNARGEGSMRTQNVTSTVNVLRFAATTRTKAVLYASSLLAVTKANGDGTLCEEFPPEDDSGELIKNGYTLTKFVCEKLMAQAQERGIPITVIRYASILGNSQTGFIPTGANHSWAILLSCIRVRKFPRFDVNGIPFMAVDTAANISAKIFLRNSSEWGVYNLTSSTVAAEEDIKAAFEKFGIEGDFLPFPEWRDLVFEEMDVEKNELGPYLPIYGENEEMQTQNYMQLHPLAKNISALRINSMSAKVWRNCPEIESDIIPATLLLERHLKFHYDQITIEK